MARGYLNISAMRLPELLGLLVAVVFLGGYGLTVLNVFDFVGIIPTMLTDPLPIAPDMTVLAIGVLALVVTLVMGARRYRREVSLPAGSLSE